MSPRGLSADLCTAAALFGLSGLLGCSPTPDYRVGLRNVPSNAAVLLFAWKSDEDTVSRTTLAVPITQLSAEERRSTSISLELAGAQGDAGVLSVATVDYNGCLTSVTSAESAPRTSGIRVGMLDIDLDATVNPAVVLPEPIPSPAVQCPAPTIPYPLPVACQRVPGLMMPLGGPTLLPTRPVMLASIRRYQGPARSYTSGGISFYGWGFDRPSLQFGPNCDPLRCFTALAMQYPELIAQLSTVSTYRYPQLKLVSYAQVELPYSEIRRVLSSDASSGFANAALYCLSNVAVSFTLTNPDSSTASFAEVLPKM